VSAAVEVVIRIIKGTIGRLYNDEIGLNLLDFPEEKR